jgi:hypothetical protein
MGIFVVWAIVSIFFPKKVKVSPFIIKKPTPSNS